jgi:hypothetical protein
LLMRAQLLRVWYVLYFTGCSQVVGLFKKGNLILKHVILFTFWWNVSTYGFAWFTVYYYRFGLRAASAANFYFLCAIQLLIITTILIYTCDLIATLVEFIRTKRYHCAKLSKAYKFKDLVYSLRLCLYWELTKRLEWICKYFNKVLIWSK